MKERIVLSDRLRAVASMVTIGNRVCDVGCDHAFVPIYLVNQKISPYVIAMDLRQGPLEQAREHIREYGFDAYIETRLSDGLEGVKINEAQSLICAGMGGRLMMSILEKDALKTTSFEELILQPQSEIQQFRAFLRNQGYLIDNENIIEEGAKFYPIIKACKAKAEEVRNNSSKNNAAAGEETWYQQMEDRYGPLLIKSKNPVLHKYIKREIDIYNEILAELRMQDISKPRLIKRYDEVKKKLDDCIGVLDCFGT